jgi:hypothetical protein
MVDFPLVKDMAGILQEQQRKTRTGKRNYVQARESPQSQSQG